MTFCKELARATRTNGDEVIAYENTDKYSAVARYEVYVCRDSIAYQVIHTARSTWKKKFNEIVKYG